MRVEQSLAKMLSHINLIGLFMYQCPTVPERIYNPITAMGFSAMFTFQLDNTLPAPHCRNGSCRYVRAVCATPITVMGSIMGLFSLRNGVYLVTAIK